MTGLYSHTNGLMGLLPPAGRWSLPESVDTIVDYLNSNGYDTAHFGTQHERVAPASNRYGLERGMPVHKKNSADVVIDDVLCYLKQPGRALKPFYVNAGFFETHPKAWGAGKYENDPDRFGDSRLYGRVADSEIRVPPHFPNQPAMREAMARFQGCIRYLDTQVGRFLEELEKLGMSGDTLVVFTTDHGIAGSRGKGTLYDLGTEIAMLVRMPGTVPQGEVINDLFPNIDLTPTLLNAAECSIPESLQGMSQWSRILGISKKPVHDAIFFERNYFIGRTNYDPMRSVRTLRHHYIRNFATDPKQEWLPHQVKEIPKDFKGLITGLWPAPTLPRDREELFDVALDPCEFRNIASESACAPVLNSMRKRLDDWMEATRDPLLNGPIPDGPIQG